MSRGAGLQGPIIARAQARPLPLLKRLSDPERSGFLVFFGHQELQLRTKADLMFLHYAILPGLRVQFLADDGDKTVMMLM